MPRICDMSVSELRELAYRQMETKRRAIKELADIEAAINETLTTFLYKVEAELRAKEASQ